MLVLADRVKESSITEGNVHYIVLNDTFGGFQSFAEGIGDGNTTYYTIENNDEFEIGVGVYDFATNTLTRDKEPTRTCPFKPPCFFHNTENDDSSKLKDPAEGSCNSNVGFNRT